MKTRFLRFSFLVLILALILGCKEECNDCKKENERLLKRLDSVSILKNGNENRSIGLSSSLKKYEVEGYFSISKNRLHLIIPTTDSTLKYEEPIGLSINGTNAILIRIDSPDVDICSPTEPVVDFIVETFSLTDPKLKLDLKELEKDEKLMIIVINNDGTDLQDIVKEYKNRIFQHGYNIKDCLMNAGCKDIEPLEADMKPNEDGGDIITGG